MKREIKFRAWDKTDKRMIIHEQDFIPLKVTSMGVLRLNPHHKESFWEFMPDERHELMQFTGLKDKNGKEIYEGDIIKQFPGFGCEFKPRIGTVIYTDASFWFNLTTIAFVLEDHDCLLEVIGNIYENPELLK